jgi:Flp pilus assembly protein TadD
MAPAQGRRLGVLFAASLLLAGCAGGMGSGPDAQEKSELTHSLIAAAASAEAGHDSVTAATYYRSALTRDPGNLQAEIGLMKALRLIGGLDEARAVAEKALAAKTTSPAVLAEAGKVKLATGQLDDAIRLLKRAVAADPKDAKSLSALGLAYDRLGDYKGAESWYRAALALAPGDAAVLNNYGLSRAMANDLDGARTLLQRAAAAPNADLRVRQNLALVYALSGEMDKAEELARHDLPPALVSETLDYYRRLAAVATTRRQ